VETAPVEMAIPERPRVSASSLSGRRLGGAVGASAIDRLWPRGVTRERARLDEWVRELAPSTELRRWFGHDPSRFNEFRRRHRAELATQQDKLRELRRRAREGTLTLVYSARDTEHNDAVVLAEILRRGRRSR
jgi:uncharacterized protein YeaO (DUF488 family)